MEIEKILKKLDIEGLNEMQQDAYNAILRSDKDIVLLSPTGSGKTLAYLLPLIQMLDKEEKRVQAIVLVPGRELALQSNTVFSDMRTEYHSCCCYGGRPTMEEHKVLKKTLPQVIFATPGRIIDHIDKGNISVDAVRILIIDEFDKCLEMGFRDEMSDVMTKLPNLKRRILLSATDADEIPRFVQMGRTQRLNFLDSEEQIPDRINLYKVKSPEKDKLETLNFLLCSLGNQSSIVFLNFRESVERVNDYLRSNGFSTSFFHGGMEQPDREASLYKFSNGSSNIFVATDLASRGLDIPDIDNIIHYHLPLNEDGYIHRVGRTARWDATGRAFFILSPNETMPEYIHGKVEEYKLPIEKQEPALPKMATIYIGKGKKDNISKGDIVGFLCKKGELKNDEIGRIDIKDRYAYAAIVRTKLSQVLKLVNGEKIKGIKTLIESIR